MLRFHIPNMACGGCARGVTAAVRTVDAGAQIVPDLQSREITVVASGVAQAPAYLGALRRAGYPAELRS